MSAATRILVTSALVILWLAGGQASLAQEMATPEPAVSSPSSIPAAAASDILPGAPHLQVVAQGVVTIEGPIIWRVRELQVGADSAPEAPVSSFALQRTGAAVIRNELTGRRLRLDPGEAAFLSSGVPVLRTAVGTDPSLHWVIEILSPDATDANSFLTGTQVFISDAVNEYPRGTFEVELARDVLLPGEVSVLPPSTGPALVMVTSGQVEVAPDGEQTTLLPAGGGRLIPDRATIRNAESQPAAFVVAAFGEPVDGAETGAGIGLPTPDPAALPTATADLPPIATVPPQADMGPAAAPTPVPVVAPTPAPAVEAPDPGLVDTDGDAIADVDEIGIYGTDPYAWDTDGDGLGDGEEVFGYGTNPLLWDTDGDGISDGQEVYAFGTNPLDPASGP